MSEAHFSNISTAIILNLRLAKKSVKIVSAFFTDGELLSVLEDLLNKGVQVILITTGDKWLYHKGRLNINNFLNKGGLFYIAELKIKNHIVHHKFCIIDNKILINGSYNWTLNARKNDENVVVMKERKLVKAFNNEFEQKRTNAVLVEKMDIHHSVFPGFLAFEKTFGWLWAGELVSFIGQIGIGIRDFFYSMSVKMANMDYKIGFVSPSASEIKNFNNLSKIQAEIPFSAQLSLLDDSQIDLLQTAFKKVANSFLIKDVPRSFNYLKKVCEGMAYQGAEILFVNDINYFMPYSKSINYEDKNHYLMIEMTKMARELGVPIIIVNELPINMEYKNYDSQIEFFKCYSDKLVLLDRAERIAKLIMKKNNYGDKGTINIEYNANTNSYQDIKS